MGGRLRGSGVLAERPELIRLSATSRAWLFVKGPQSVRILIEGNSVGVYGPGTKISHCTFTEAMDATIHQADIEHALVRDGWLLEQLTTERRSAHADAGGARRPERRRTTLRLVPSPDDANG